MRPLGVVALLLNYAFARVRHVSKPHEPYHKFNKLHNRNKPSFNKIFSSIINLLCYFNFILINVYFTLSRTTNLKSVEKSLFEIVL